MNQTKLSSKTNAKTELSFSKKRFLTERIALVIVIGVLTLFFGKIAIWEHLYYTGMEGSTRAVAITHTEDEPTEANEVDETPVTEEERIEYTVPADHPRYLSIPSLGIYNARVLEMGLTATGELDTPYGIFDVGWYNQSGKPGSGRTVLIDGHNGGPNVEGVFKHIDALSPGDTITLERGDGETFTYSVVENHEISLDESDAYMSTAMTSARPGHEGLTLITCIGEWSQVRQTYLSRQFVRAVLE